MYGVERGNGSWVMGLEKANGFVGHFEAQPILVVYIQPYEDIHRNEMLDRIYSTL